MSRLLRRTLVSMAIGVLLVAGAASPALAAEYQKYLPVPADQQLESNWCWAASNQSIVKYIYGITYYQCSQAADIYGNANCCNSPWTCNWPQTLENIKTIDAKKGISTTHYYSALSFATTESYINSSRPFMAAIGWAGGGGHAMVMRGYDWLQGSNGYQWVYLMDPASGSYVSYEYAYFVNNSSWKWAETLTY
jgi:hypothetical protein